MTWPVLLYVPNLIGYFRVITAIIAIRYAFTDYKFSALMYFCSYFADMFDGYAARWLNQSTKFGGLLDMVTDRASSASLLVVLSHLYKDYKFVWMFFFLLDIFAHWIQMYSQLLDGKSSHKSMTTEPWILRIYYQQWALVTLVAFNEAFLQAAYLSYFTPGDLVTIAGHTYGIWHWAVFFSVPFFALKQTIGVVAFFYYTGKIIAYDQHAADEAAAKKQ